MNVNKGEYCTLYKQCKICGDFKYKTKFPNRRGKKHASSCKKSYCHSCNSYKEAHFYEPANGYSFDTDLLSRNKAIQIHGKNSTEQLYRKDVSYKRAKRLVTEGAAGIVYSTLIHHLFTPKTFRMFIFERDNYKCHYCNNSGNTIDHKRPRSKGGYSTPENCVCACKKCNLHKADMDYESYINRVKIST